MIQRQGVEVAVLLATHNGVRFIESQIRSLKRNTTSFTLHWLDDCSTDGTADLVRSVANSVGIKLKEWSQAQRQGVPGAFFWLLENVEADIYMFCDQDDVWQDGKIDATVRNLLDDVANPVLFTSDPLLFRDDEDNPHYRFSDLVGTNLNKAMQESRLFMSTLTHGTTQGFTRPLRDMFILHKDIAREYAVMHDVWMYDIAIASGTFRLAHDVPTALHRWHTSNVSHTFSTWKGCGMGRITVTWRQQQWTRRALARHAQGFIVAAATLPPSARLQRAVSIAHRVARLHLRQSPLAFLRLALSGALWPAKRLAIGLMIACLCTHAKK